MSTLYCKPCAVEKKWTGTQYCGKSVVLCYFVVFVVVVVVVIVVKYENTDF